MIKLLMALCFLYSGTVIAAEQQNTVPKRFYGEWRHDCKSKVYDDELKITANQLLFHESTGDIKAIVTHGKSEIAIISEFSGEGGTWLGYNYFRLSDDSKSLTDITDTETPFVRYKCSKNSK